MPTKTSTAFPEPTQLFRSILAGCGILPLRKKAMEWYAGNHLMPKDKNPPNKPELYQIEQYWAIVKRNLKKTQKAVVSEKQFKAHWRSAANKVEKETVQNLMAGVKRESRQFVLGKKEG